MTEIAGRPSGGGDLMDAIYCAHGGVRTPSVAGTHRCNYKGGSILDSSPDFLRKSVEDILQQLGLKRLVWPAILRG
jgi:hypothetical protein